MATEMEVEKIVYAELKKHTAFAIALKNPRKYLIKKAT